MTQPTTTAEGHQILLSEWAGRLEPGSARLLGSSVDRKPCPICGHPTGDCTTHQEETNHG